MHQTRNFVHKREEGLYCQNVSCRFVLWEIANGHVSYKSLLFSSHRYPLLVDKWGGGAIADSPPCTIYYYHFRRIRQIRRFIDERSLRLLVHAFITSRLDYCNGLFANCSVAVRQRLQPISEFRTALLVWYVQNLLLATLHHCCAGYTGYNQLPGV